MEEEYIEHLILNGAVEASGLDSETGEFLYRFTDKLKEVDPDLYKSYLASVHQDVMYFFERGFLDMSDITSSNPIIKLTDKAFDREALKSLTDEELLTFNSIKAVLKVI